MRTRTIIAVLAIATVFASCVWIFEKDNKTETTQLEGRWKLDTILMGKDTSSLFPLLLAMASKDSSNKPLEISVTKDSLYTIYPNGTTDTSIIKIDTARQQIAIQDEPAQNLYFTTEDSSLTLTFSDSTILRFTRK